jgi:hypothetical protein
MIKMRLAPKKSAGADDVEIAAAAFADIIEEPFESMASTGPCGQEFIEIGIVEEIDIYFKQAKIVSLIERWRRSHR